MMRAAGLSIEMRSVPALWIAAGLAAISMQWPAAFAATPSPASTSRAAATTSIDFVKEVEPLFERHCYSCHGPDAQESGLRLDDANMALKGGDLGPAYVPGDSA